MGDEPNSLKYGVLKTPFVVDGRQGIVRNRHAIVAQSDGDAVTVRAASLQALTTAAQEAARSTDVRPERKAPSAQSMSLGGNSTSPNPRFIMLATSSGKRLVPADSQPVVPAEPSTRETVTASPSRPWEMREVPARETPELGTVASGKPTYQVVATSSGRRLVPAGSELPGPEVQPSTGPQTTGCGRRIVLAQQSSESGGSSRPKYKVVATSSGKKLVPVDEGSVMTGPELQVSRGCTEGSGTIGCGRSILPAQQSYESGSSPKPRYELVATSSGKKLVRVDDVAIRTSTEPGIQVAGGGSLTSSFQFDTPRQAQEFKALGSEMRDVAAVLEQVMNAGTRCEAMSWLANPSLADRVRQASRKYPTLWDWVVKQVPTMATPEMAVQCAQLSREYPELKRAVDAALASVSLGRIIPSESGRESVIQRQYKEAVTRFSHLRPRLEAAFVTSIMTPLQARPSGPEARGNTSLSRLSSRQAGIDTNDGGLEITPPPGMQPSSSGSGVVLGSLGRCALPLDDRGIWLPGMGTVLGDNGHALARGDRLPTYLLGWTPALGVGINHANLYLMEFDSTRPGHPLVAKRQANAVSRWLECPAIAGGFDTHGSQNRKIWEVAWLSGIHGEHWNGLQNDSFPYQHQVFVRAFTDDLKPLCDDVPICPSGGDIDFQFIARPDIAIAMNSGRVAVVFEALSRWQTQAPWEAYERPFLSILDLEGHVVRKPFAVDVPTEPMVAGNVYPSVSAGFWPTLGREVIVVAWSGRSDDSKHCPYPRVKLRVFDTDGRVLGRTLDIGPGTTPRVATIPGGCLVTWAGLNTMKEKGIFIQSFLAISPWVPDSHWIPPVDCPEQETPVIDKEKGMPVVLAPIYSSRMKVSPNVSGDPPRDDANPRIVATDNGAGVVFAVSWIVKCCEIKSGHFPMARSFTNWEHPVPLNELHRPDHSTSWMTIDNGKAGIALLPSCSVVPEWVVSYYSQSATPDRMVMFSRDQQYL